MTNNFQTTDTPEYSSIMEELFTKYNLVVVIFSILAISIAVLIEIFNLRTDENIVSFVLLRLLSVVLTTTSIAFLVAIYISAVIESKHRKKLEAKLDLRITRITEEVFKGVFKVNLPKELVQVGVEQIFGTSIVRENTKLTYTLSDASYMHASEGNPDEEIDYIKLKAKARFDLVNYSSKIEKVCPKLILPNPLVPEMKKSVKVDTFVVNGVKFNKAHANQKIQEQLKGNYPGNHVQDIVITFPETFELLPGQRITASLTYCMAKEIEDTEVFRTAYPMNGLSVTINPKSKYDLAILSRSLHNSDTESNKPEEEGGLYIWDVNGYILNHQGMMFWWKKADTLTIMDNKI